MCRTASPVRNHRLRGQDENATPGWFTFGAAENIIWNVRTPESASQAARRRKEQEMSWIGEKISRLRTDSGMTQAEFAEQMDVSRQTVSKWELGAALPEPDKIVEISELFHVSTDYLLKSRPDGTAEGILDRLVLRFLGCARDIDAISQDLIGIVRDGKIDEGESARLEEITRQLDGVSQTVEALRKHLEARRH